MSGFRWDRATYDSARYASNSERWVLEVTDPVRVVRSSGDRYDRFAYDGSTYAGATAYTFTEQSLQVVDHSREPNRLTLEMRVRTDSARAFLADLKDDAGSYTERVRADGVYEARDTVGGSNTIEVTPPARYSPPRQSGTYLVDDVTAERTSADGLAERASVTLVPEVSRAEATDAVLATTAAPWELAFSLGTIRTARVASDIRNDGDTVELRLTLTPEEADVLEASAAAVGGVVSETLPDEDTRVRDVTPTSRQTVTLTPPTESPVDAGDYAVLAWTTDAVTSARHQTTITLDAV
jgi:hypothetical protein